MPPDATHRLSCDESLVHPTLLLDLSDFFVDPPVVITGPDLELFAFLTRGDAYDGGGWNDRRDACRNLVSHVCLLVSQQPDVALRGGAVDWLLHVLLAFLVLFVHSAAE